MINIIVGLILLVIGIFGIIPWWKEFGLVLRGLIPFVFLITGLVAIGAGLTKDKNKNSEKD